MSNESEQFRGQGDDASLRELVANAPWVLFAFRLKDGVMSVPYASPGLEKLFGIANPESLLQDATALFERMPPEDRQRIEASILESARTLAPWRGEFRIQRPDGALVWIEGKSQPRREEDGAVLWHGFCHDISRQRQTLAELKQARGVQELLIEQAPLSIAMFNRDMVYLAASRQWRQDFARGQEVLGRCHYEIVPDIPERWRQIHRECLAGAVRSEEQDPWLQEDGISRWIRWLVHPWHDADGQIGGILIFSEDVTARVQTGEQLQKSELRSRTLHGEAMRAELARREGEERLESIIHSAMDGIITTADSLRIVMVNPAAERMFGRSAFELLGQPLDLLIPERYRERHSAAMLTFGRTGVVPWRTGPGKVQGLRASGEEFPLEVSISFCEINGKTFYTAILRDISERDRTQKTLKALEVQVQQAQKMESIGQLAGGVAHDFNNLLTVILSSAEALEEEEWSLEDARELIRDIRDAGQRGASLTRQLLAFSRQEIVEPRVVDLGAVVSDTQKMLRRLLGEDISLTTRLNSASCPVKIDPGQWSQVLLNLAVNARDAMPRGGDLVIETRVIPPAPGEEGRRVALLISDTGCGMAAEVKARIFEPFFTTKSRGRGTGLGLAVVYGVVHQAGGTIDVESALETGTRFTITLPGVAQQASPSHAPEQAARTGSELILLVEDEESVRRVAARILRSNGYRVLVAEDGREALNILEHQEEPVRLLLTDVVMPVMDGSELVRIARIMRPGIRVLYTSGYMDDVVARRGVFTQGVAFLQKPYLPAVLLGRVREVLDAPGEDLPPRGGGARDNL